MTACRSQVRRGRPRGAARVTACATSAGCQPSPAQTSHTAPAACRPPGPHDASRPRPGSMTADGRPAEAVVPSPGDLVPARRRGLPDGRIPARSGRDHRAGAVVERGARGAQDGLAGPVVVAAQQQVHRVPTGGCRRHDDGDHRHGRAAARTAGRGNRVRPPRQLIVRPAWERVTARSDPALHTTSVAAPDTGCQRHTSPVPRVDSARAAAQALPPDRGALPSPTSPARTTAAGSPPRPRASARLVPIPGLPALASPATPRYLWLASEGAGIAGPPGSTDGSPRERVHSH